MTQETKGTVLLVEDDEYISSVYKIALENAGYTVVHAENGLDALKKLTQATPAVILLDIIMPDMDGFEVLEKIRSRPEYEQVPIVVCSNLSQRSDIDKALENGANDYLLKGDISLHELVEKVDKYARTP